MRSDLTDITLVVDRSGSMQEIRSDAEGGVLAFIENQAKEPGDALLGRASHARHRAAFIMHATELAANSARSTD